MRRVAFAVGVAAVAGCVQGPQIEKIGEDPISIALSLSTTSLQIGRADTIRVVVRNNLDQAVRLLFTNVCQVYVTIRNQAGDIVTPRDGRPGCLAVNSSLVLAAGGQQTFTSIWTGGFDFAPPDTPGKVPNGSYFVSAQLIASGYSTLAPAIKVDVTR
jgi:hypothetical protein